MEYRTTLFAKGDCGIDTFRIPSIICLPSGKVLAFCEGRLDSEEDYGNITIVMRASADGEHFSPVRKLLFGNGHAISNPSPIYDSDKGRLFLMYNRNFSGGNERFVRDGKGRIQVFCITSDDEGETWSEEKEITRYVMKPEWTYHAFGPCHGVYAGGRLMSAANHNDMNSDDRTFSHVVYSDDHGETWKVSNDLEKNSNEATLAAYGDGSVLINMRWHTTHKEETPVHCRLQAYSSDNGASFSGFEVRDDLIDPGCEASLLTIKTENGDETLFCNNESEKRENLTVKRSADKGRTWQTAYTVEKGLSAYSDMAQLKDGRIAVLYETGLKGPYEEIKLCIFSL